MAGFDKRRDPRAVLPEILRFWTLFDRKVTFPQEVRLCNVYYGCGISFPTNPHMTWSNLAETGKLRSIDPNPTLSLKEAL